MFTRENQEPKKNRNTCQAKIHFKPIIQEAREKNLHMSIMLSKTLQDEKHLQCAGLRNDSTTSLPAFLHLGAIKLVNFLVK